MQHLLSLGTQGNPKPSWKELAFPDSVSRQGAVERKGTVLWEATRPSRCSCQLLDWILWPGKEDRAGGKGERYWRSRDLFKGIKLCIWNYTVGCPLSYSRGGHGRAPERPYILLHLLEMQSSESSISSCASTVAPTSMSHVLTLTSVCRVLTLQHPHPCAMCTLCSMRIHVPCMPSLIWDLLRRCFPSPELRS